MQRSSDPNDTVAARRRDLLRKLILMRETGPKSQAWHRARVQMIWRLHAELEHSQVVDPNQHVSVERET